MISLWRRIRIAFMEYRVEKAAKRFFEARDKLAAMKIAYNVKHTDRSIAIEQHVEQIKKNNDAAEKALSSIKTSTKTWN